MTGDLTKWSSPDIAQPESNDVKFKRNGGLFITKKALFFIVALVVLLIIVAVFVTKILTEKQYKDEKESNNDTSSEFSSIIRLSEDIKPFHYELKLEPYLNAAPSNKEKFTLYGEVLIHFKALKPTSTVTLNYAGTFVKYSSASNDKNKSLAVKSDKYIKNLELYTLDFVENIETGVNLTLHLTFRNEIKDEEKGFYRSSFGSANSTIEEWMAASNLEPAFARTMFPCFDEPKFRTTFDISVNHLKNITVLANTNKQTSISNKDHADWIWDSFERTPPMPTHKVGIVIGDLAVSKIYTDKITVSIWTRTDLLNVSISSVEITTSLLRHYHSYFTAVQPIRKLDLVAVPNRVNDDYTAPWALILFSESLIFKNKNSKDEAKFALEIGAKMAEQWFGNLVSVNWWNDVWMKKSLSLYAAYHAVNKIKPDFDIMSDFMIDVFQKALDIESYPHAHHIYTLSDIRDFWFSSAHLKGSSLLLMIDSLSSPEHFQESINSYLEERKLNVSSYLPLWQFLSNVFKNTHINLMEFVDNWFIRPGYPLVNCQYNKQNGEVLLDQQPFYLQHSPSKYSAWDIPISYTSEKITADPERKWFYHNDTSLKFVLDSNKSWILLNVPKLRIPQGFFRVNYNIENWISLSKAALREEEIALLLDDSYQLAKVGRVPYYIPFNISLDSMNKSLEYLPMRAVDTHLDYLKPFLHEHRLFQNFVERLFAPSLNKTVDISSVRNDYVKSEMKKIIDKWACTYHTGDCRSSALSSFESLIQKGNHSVELLPLQVLRTAIRYGNEINLRTVFNRYSTKTLIPIERIKLLQALATSNNRTFIIQLLESTIGINNLETKRFSDEEVFEIWNSLSENLDLKDMVFNFFLEHWDHIYKSYHSNHRVFSAIIKGATDSLTEEQHLIKLTSLNDRVIKETNTPSKCLEEAMNRLIVKTAWRKTKLDSVLNYLQ